MNSPETDGQERFLRLALPARFSFNGVTFQCSELAVEMDPPGLKVVAESNLEVGSDGHVTLVISRWESPFRLAAEIVQVEKQAGSTAAEYLIRFKHLEGPDRHRLEQLLAGRAGSVPEAIRRAAREPGRTLLLELRRRPASQKMMFALQARREEFEAILRDGNPSVLLRLLENPRLERQDIVAMLRDPRTPPRLLAVVAQDHRYKGDGEIRALLCAHPLMPMEEALALLATLPVARLKILARNPALRPPLRQKAKQRAGMP